MCGFEEYSIIRENTDHRRNNRIEIFIINHVYTRDINKNNYFWLGAMQCFKCILCRLYCLYNWKK